jgi:hypothetical protein
VERLECEKEKEDLDKAMKDLDLTLKFSENKNLLNVASNNDDNKNKAVPKKSKQLPASDAKPANNFKRTTRSKLNTSK